MIKKNQIYYTDYKNINYENSNWHLIDDIKDGNVYFTILKGNGKNIFVKEKYDEFIVIKEAKIRQTIFESRINRGVLKLNIKQMRLNKLQDLGL